MHPIAARNTVIHARLTERVAELRRRLGRYKPHELAEPAGGMLIDVVGRLLAEIYRLVSREPGARALVRINRKGTYTNGALLAALRDGQVALDAYRHAHWDHEGDYTEDWLTFEGLDPEALDPLP